MPQGDRKKIEVQPDTPKEWRDAIADNVQDMRTVRLAWKTSNNSHSLTPVCDDLDIAVTTAYEHSGRKVYTIDCGVDGFMGPAQFSDELWSRCYAVYLAERDARGGSLSAIVAELEVLDQHNNELAHVTKAVRPELREDGSTVHWVEDIETPEERRDRSLLAEMRRRDHHYNNLLKQQADTIVALSATVVQVHASSMDAREQLIREREADQRARAETAGSDENARRMWDVIEMVAKKKMDAEGHAVPGEVDPLIKSTRGFLDAIDDDTWAELSKISESFADLRSACEQARADDCEREALYAALDVVRVTIANEPIDQMAVARTMSGEAIMHLQAMWAAMGPA